MNNIKIVDSRFYEFSDLVLSQSDKISYLERGQFLDDYRDARPLPISFKCAPLEDNDFVTQDIVNTFRSLSDDFNMLYNVETKISVLYPPSGFIGWHTNANQNQYNAICTFSENGDGVFKYLSNKIVEVKDIPGWTVKKSKWFDESIPHMAYTNCNRITIAFTSNSQDVIDNFILKITNI